MRLIDAEAFKQQIAGCAFVLGNIDKALLLCEMIDMAPTIDAVVVVRCGECTCFERDVNDHSSGWCECANPDGSFRDRRADDFCSYSERKEAAKSSEIQYD